MRRQVTLLDYCVYREQGGCIIYREIELKVRAIITIRETFNKVYSNLNEEGGVGRGYVNHHQAYGRFYRGMEHMCQSMCNTRSRLQSSTRLLTAMKARASPNQLINFNASPERIHPPPPTMSNVYVDMTSALVPVFKLISIPTL